MPQPADKNVAGIPASPMKPVPPGYQAARGGMSKGACIAIGCGVGCLSILLLVGVLSPVVVYMMNNARDADARHRVDALSMALEQYYQDRGQYPSDEFRSRPVVQVTRVSNENMVECLDGDGIQPMIPWGTEDDNGTPYFDFPEEDLDPMFRDRQAYLDPWGKPINYRENYSKKYSAPHNFVKNRLVKRWASFDLWSEGRDGRTNMQQAEDDSNEDDICNWEN